MTEISVKYQYSNNQRKKILYYIDPIINNGDSDFRLPTLKYHLPIWVDAFKKIKKFEEDIDILFITSDYLKKTLISSGVGEDWPISVIDYDLIRSIVKSGVNSYEDLNIADKENLKNLFLNAIGEFDPDLIIVYESYTPYLSDIFPGKKIVNEYWGIFSRSPMPALTTFDFDGIYDKSALYKYSEDIKRFEINEDDEKLLNKIRSIVSSNLFSIDPCYEHVIGSKSEFDKLLLLPFQIDNYIAFDNCSEFSNHEELLVAVLNTIPSNYGLIVTQHQDHKKILNDNKIKYYRNKYANFIYYDDLEEVPMLSNFILNYVDGIITTSSSLGFHAALLKLPVFVPGRSQLSLISSGSILEIDDFFRRESRVNWDNVIYWILTHYQFSLEFELKEYFSVKSIINELTDKNNIGFAAYERRLNNDQVLEIFESGSRKKDIELIFNQKGIKFFNNEIYVKICEADAVSFDLFDTLVERPFIEPHYLFQLIEPAVRRYLGISNFQFMRFRRMAEEAARKARGWKETTLTEIYRHFEKITGLDRYKCQEISKLEFEAEKTVLTKRREYFEVFEFSKKIGKVVSIITDIYLEKEYILDILDNVGIFGYDHLLVSASEDKRKHDGTIFPDYISLIYDKYRFRPNGKSLLHIGDNGHADCKMAISFNIRCHVIPKSIDSFKRSDWFAVYKDNFSKRYMISDVLVGLIANRFGSTLVGKNKESLFGDSLFRVGYAAAGPMLFSFVQWLVSNVRKKKYKKIYFLARDGYLLKNIYDKIYESEIYSDLPVSGYLYASRRCAAVAAIESWDDIVDLYHLSFGNRKVGEFIESRFGLKKNDIDKNVLREFGYSINDVIYQSVDVSRHLELLFALKESIFDNARSEREDFKRYIVESGIVGDGSDVCVVDIGYSGSIQKFINKIIGDGKISGYYLLTHESSRKYFENVECEGFFKTFDEQRMADCHSLNNYVFLFESVLSSSEESVVRHVYEENLWSMQTKPSNKEDERLNFMRHVHLGVNAFASDFISVLGKYLDDVQLGQYLGSKAFFSLAMSPLKRDAMLFKGLMVENNFGGGDAWLLFDSKIFKDYKKMNQKDIDVAIGSSQWKEAAHAIFSENKNNIIAEKQISLDGRYNSVNSEYKIKDMNLPKVVRKYMKYKKNPYIYFNDSKNPLVRLMRFFYLKYRDVY